ncbi:MULTISPECIES: chemotaxis protein CheB [unclassified Caballeronia]|uniref:chemotaxis protein CheB n=1 Tax=unclassified Caballeronia TaxID=2646786 RepID=UPI0028543FB1|nr:MULTISPECIES: chemotaxis protein CheB [unclassified Caballeronia]MDR5738407.1 chemotaxis protein CheB [Caballeronia sp. LZ016]MDR5811738.1 chemotaxis protein CheB [Caballeronia sp. LZ019]
MDHRDIVVIAASRGAIPVLKKLIAAFPADFPAAVCIVLHIGRHKSVFPEMLTEWGVLPARHPKSGERLERRQIYVAPPDRHMILLGGKVRLLDTAAENFARPAADPLFRSAAMEFGPRVVGVVLSGDLDDGAAGLAAVRARGGYCVVQDPADCEAPSMPRSALAATSADAVVKIDELAGVVDAAVRGARGREEVQVSTRPDLDREVQIGNKGVVPPEELDQIGERSALTCPNCSGTLWRMRDEQPLRYRCHTGHAFTSLSLEEGNAKRTEDGIWSAIRAVHERIILAQERRRWAEHAGSADDVAIEQIRIEENEKLAELLREAIGIQA